MQEIEIVFDPLPPDALSRFVMDSLATHNIAATGLSAWYPVGFFLKSRDRRVAGRAARQHLGRLAACDASMGGHGHTRHGRGTRLLQAAENYAVERGCFGATLETHELRGAAVL